MSYELPDPLPEMLPGETNTNYRDRVIPHHREFRRIARSFENVKKRARERENRRLDRPMTTEEYEAAMDEAWADWADADPSRADRYAELFYSIPRIKFDPAPVACLPIGDR